MTGGIDLTYSGMQAYAGSLDGHIAIMGRQSSAFGAQGGAMAVGTGFAGATELVAAHQAALQQMRALLGQIHGGISTVRGNTLRIQANYAQTDSSLAGELYPGEAALTI